MQYDYSKNTPPNMKWVIALIGLLAVMPLLNLLWMGFFNLEFAYSEKLELSNLGELGDFFGGHMAAFAGSMSLLVVLFFTFHQAKQQSQFFEEQQHATTHQSERNFFLQGINLITEWDMESPGCDQCMRLLDYYGRIALKSEDRELALILNTVITSEIRKNLQGKNGRFKHTNYPYAVKVMVKIAVLRKEDGMNESANDLSGQVVDS